MPTWQVSDFWGGGYSSAMTPLPMITLNDVMRSSKFVMNVMPWRLLQTLQRPPWCPRTQVDDSCSKWKPLLFCRYARTEKLPAFSPNPTRSAPDCHLVWTQPPAVSSPNTPCHQEMFVTEGSRTKSHYKDQLVVNAIYGKITVYSENYTNP
jgi:hypothetical protein